MKEKLSHIGILEDQPRKLKCKNLDAMTSIETGSIYLNKTLYAHRRYFTKQHAQCISRPLAWLINWCKRRKYLNSKVWRRLQGIPPLYFPRIHGYSEISKKTICGELWSHLAWSCILMTLKIIFRQIFSNTAVLSMHSEFLDWIDYILLQIKFRSIYPITWYFLFADIVSPRL